MHFFLNAIGMVAGLNIALHFWGAELSFLTENLGVYDHVIFNRTKALDLILHVGGVLILSIYFAATRAWLRSRTIHTHVRSQLGIIWLLAVGLYNGWLLQWQPAKPVTGLDWLYLAVTGMLWLFLVAAPVYGPVLLRRCQAIDWRRQWNPANTGRVYFLLVFLAVGQLLWLMAPFSLQRLQLLNEYLEIPTTTFIYETNRTMTDQKFFDDRHLLGPALRYSPDRDRGRTPLISDEACVMTPVAPGLKTFLQEDANKTSLLYDPQQQRLCSVDALSSEQWLHLRSLQTDVREQQKLDAWFASVSNYAQRMRDRVLSKDERQYLRVNRFTLGFQFAGNGVIHHHGFMLNPLNEYDHGKPREAIFAQYGWLNLWLTHGLMQVMGGMNFHNYFRIWYSYYYLYYLLYFGLLWLIFRRRAYLAAGALLAVGLLSFIEYQWLLQLPGINPIRRILELPLLVGLWLYWRQPRPRYLLFVILCLWLAILNNWQFGLMALGAAGVCLGVQRWQQGGSFGKTTDCLLGVGLIGGLLLMQWLRGGNDPSSSYYLAGSAAMPIGLWKGPLILIVFAAGAALLAKLFDPWRPLAYLCLFLLLYTAAVVTYSLWNGTPTYMLVPGPLYVLTGLAFSRFLSEKIPVFRLFRRKIAFLLVIIGLGVLLTGGWDQERTRNEFLGILDSHQIYEWDLDRAKLTSTMDPRYFQNGVALIEKYSQDTKIHIISKYDNFLPFLAGRYSAMPYFEMSKFLISPRETALCVERLLTDRPEYLFVDTDIHRDYAADMVHRFSPLGALNPHSRYRIAQMQLMQKVFATVQDQYELVEQGLILSVYKRRQ
jgi:hypothetical protein